MEAANRTARIFQILIGLVYLISGAIKTWEPILFYWEAIPYTQLLGFGREYFQPVAKGAVLFPLRSVSASRWSLTGCRGSRCPLQRC